jgi:hypothetical protein
MRHLLATLLVTAAGASVAADYGIEFPADATARPLSSALAEAESGIANKPMLLSGRVGQVCRKQGCWMTLIDGDATARVMTGHRFFLPTDTTGAALVYGTLQRRALDAKTAAHFAAESDAHAAPGEEFRIDALAIRID